MTDVDLEELLGHLRATAKLPIERDANRWLGEAEAVVADLAASDLDPAVLEERLETVEELLDHVSETGHDEADDHVTAAKALLSER